MGRALGNKWSTMFGSGCTAHTTAGLHPGVRREELDAMGFTGQQDAAFRTPFGNGARYGRAHGFPVSEFGARCAAAEWRGECFADQGRGIFCEPPRSGAPFGGKV